MSSVALERAIAELTEQIANEREREALTRIDALAAANPHSAELLRLRGVALLRLRDAAGALDAFERARSIAPMAVDVLCNLASAQRALDRDDDAETTLRAALAIAPTHVIAASNLGALLHARRDYASAAHLFERALASEPSYANAWLNFAAARLALGDARAAEDAARRAIALVERWPDAWFVLGNALDRQTRTREAIDAYRACLRLDATHARAWHNLALALGETGALDDASRACEQALALDPTLTQALGELVFLKRRRCDWDGLDVLSERVRAAVDAGVTGIAPFAFLSEPASAKQQLKCAQLRAAEVAADVARPSPPPSALHAHSDDPLRVAFVSNGFGEHPTGVLIASAIEALAREPLELHAFATSADDNGPIRRRLRAAFHHFDEAHDLAPIALAERIRTRDIDVLIDLRGWGGGNVAAALALRPAPLQVNWLAFPGTTGAPWIDYAIADRFVLPPSLRADFSEAVAWLPRCFQPSDDTRPVFTPPSRSDCGLPENGVVFCSFNNSYKFTQATFASWMRILRAVPNSVLWLLAPPVGADARLRAAAAAVGIDATRLVFMPKTPHLDYLARYRHADLFLDTNPYNAHTTASDALWAGCPVLTRPGETFASRVAGSLNHHLALDAMNVSDKDAYEATAIRLGNDRGALAAVRATLAKRRGASGLFDMRAFARDFADLLQRMADRHRAGLPPQALE